MYTHTDMYIHTHTDTHTDMYTHTQTCTYTHMYIHTDTCTIAHTYTDVHTKHTHIVHVHYTHTPPPHKKLQYFIVHSQSRVLHSRVGQRAQHTLLALLSQRSAIEQSDGSQYQ
ncbi:unnamed protein product [Staurois parvus]|uniref:Uncharacterized protein n=1 Tax=Staurois parvus TaxID=386267 RepID=A0ABN9GA68_9NEOB|nr:unnamed protein product [Staurois parvus]